MPFICDLGTWVPEGLGKELSVQRGCHRPPLKPSPLQVPGGAHLRTRACTVYPETTSNRLYGRANSSAGHFPPMSSSVLFLSCTVRDTTGPMTVLVGAAYAGSGLVLKICRGEWLEGTAEV